MRDRRLIRRTAWAAAAAASLWAGFAGIVVPRLIQDAYHLQSYPVFNRMILGRHEKPLAYYHDKWRTIAYRFALLPPLLAGLGVIASPHWLAVARDTAFHGMRPLRVGVATGVVGFIFIGSATDIVLYQEHWPFSNYPMFARAQRTTGESGYFRLLGVTESGAEREASRLVPPFDPPRLALALEQQVWNGTIEEATQNLFRLHRRQADRPFVRLRVYYQRRVFGPDGERVTRTLVYECIADEKEW